MDMITLDWKSNIFRQLKEHNRQGNGYNDIVEQCRYFPGYFIHWNRFLLCLIDNRIWENNGILKAQCSKLEKDVNHLRLTNAGLEKASIVKYIFRQTLARTFVVWVFLVNN